MAVLESSIKASTRTLCTLLLGLGGLGDLAAPGPCLAAPGQGRTGQALKQGPDRIAEYFFICDPDSFAFLYQNPKQNHYISVRLAYRDRTWSDTKLRIRGDSSRSLPKKSLKLEFPSEAFADGSQKLNFNAEFLDPSYMRTVLVSRLFKDTGHPGFSAEHARLYLNGAFLGLYIRVENMDEVFLRRNGLDPEGNLYKATWDGALLSTSDDVDFHWEKKTNVAKGRDDLHNLIFLINRVPDREYLNFARHFFDYDKMVNIIALNILLANGSTYYHNYYMFHDLKGSGKWAMLPWDTDRTFSRYGRDSPYHRSSQPLLPDNPFLERALLNEEILAAVKARIDELNQTYFSPDHLFPIVDSLEVLLESTIGDDSADDVADLAQWRRQINGEKGYILSRYDRLQGQLEKWPAPFQTLPLRWIDDRPWLVWQAADNRAGGRVSYTLKYGRDSRFPNAGARTVADLTDTAFALPAGLRAGMYFWNVMASNSFGDYEAFDSRAIFHLPPDPTQRAAPDSSALIVTEVNYHAAAEYNSGDWIELYNPHDRAVDLSGWYFKDSREDNLFMLPYRSSIGSYKYLVLCQDREDFQAVYPRAGSCLGDWEFALSRSGDSVRLYNAEGVLRDSLTYGNQYPWSTGADGSGATLQLLDVELDNASPASWAASRLFGTPGQPNARDREEGRSGLRNFPNPFNDTTTITFALPVESHCQLDIFDVRGKKVVSLLDEPKAAGLHAVDWGGANGRGDRLASGSYYIRLRAAGLEQSRKMILLK